MKELIEFSPAWNDLLDLIRDRQSSLLLAPRNYGDWSVLERYARQYSTGESLKSFTISSRVPLYKEDIDYSWLWNAIITKTGTKNKAKIKTVSSFLNGMTELLRDNGAHFLVFVGGSGRGHEETHYRVVSAFQRLLGTGNLTIVATDDYSSFYFQKQNFLLSDLHSLTAVQIGPTTAHAVAEYLREADPVAHADCGLEVAERIIARTGGHIGLTQEVLRAMERSHWPISPAEWRRVIDASFKSSVVLENITRALEEDAQGYCETALEYGTPAIPEQNSPRIHVLRQLGVLHRATPPQLQLCGGAIADIVRSVATERKAGRPNRLGTIVSEGGPRMYEEGPVDLTDEDLVILHVSDLHVGDNYRYRLTWSGGQINPNEQSAAEVLRDDLSGLGVQNRIDGLIISGDFVWKGAPEEFRRASTVVKELMAAAGVDASHTVLIPGNHDVEWNPGSLSSRSYGKAVSRESYEDFIELLGKQRGEIDAARIVSRSGKSALHVIGLDSNRVEGPNAAGIGFVSRDTLMTAGRLAQSTASELEKLKLFTWIAVHHHVFPATSAALGDAQTARVSTMANSAELLEYAVQWKAEAILHGHEHQPCVTVGRRWPSEVGDVFSPIASVGAGSFGVKRDFLGPFSRNHYFMLIRRPSGILIRSRCQGSGGVRFVPHSDLWLPR